MEEPNGDRTTTSWDFENRTTLVEESTGIRNTMAYEPGGLRVKLEESSGTKKFIWDQQNYLAETDENDDTQVVYTNEPRVYGNLVSQRRGTDSHWYCFDAIGSTRELTDSGETLTDTRLYDAWGIPISASGSTTFPFTFVGAAGYYHCSAPARNYVRAREYEPDLGRWLSVDPIASSIVLVLSRFAYSRNSPLVASDPSGLYSVTNNAQGGTGTFGEGIPCVAPTVMPEVQDGYSSLFHLTPAERSEVPELVFYQLVENLYEFSCQCILQGSCESGFCCGSTKSIQLMELFVEAFNPHTSTNGLGTAQDKHTCSSKSLIDYFDASCTGESCKRCCKWSFRKVTRKTLTLAPAITGMLLTDTAWRQPTPKLIALNLDCGDCGSPTADPRFDGIAFPGPHKEVAGIHWLPVGARGTLEARFTCRRHHDACADPYWGTQFVPYAPT